MNWFIAVILLTCAMSSSATPCSFELDPQTFSRISEDPVLEPLAREWLNLSGQSSPPDESFLRTTYSYLIFISDFLKLRERPNEDLANNPYVNFLRNLFEGKKRGIDLGGAVEVTSRFLERFMTGQGADRNRLPEMIEAIQINLVPEMAQLQVKLTEAQNGDSSSRASRMLSNLPSPFEDK